MLLVFGPDQTYFFDDGAGHFKWRAGPEFNTYMANNRIGKINSVALGEGGAYLLSYTTPDGRQHMNSFNDPGNHYTSLHAWLFTENIPHLRNSVQVSMGPNGSYFAASSQGHRWRNIPEGLSDYYQKFTRVDLFTKSRVNNADIGYNGTFLGIGVDSVWFWNLGDEYPELSKLIGQKGISNCRYVGINPFASNQHIAIFNNGTVHWSLPPLWIQDIQSLVQELATSAGAHLPTAAPRPPARPHSNSSSQSGRWKPSWRPGSAKPPPASPPPPAPAASPTVSTPGGNSLDWNQAMGVTQSALDAYNNAQGQGQSVSNGLQIVNNLANNGLMVGQVVGQLGAAAACSMM